jgi:inosine/xanthosine triphosphatase
VLKLKGARLTRLTEGIPRHTAACYLPEETAKLVREGVELGPAEDQIWGQSNTKQKGGSVGLLTNNVIDRSGYYVQAVILALIPFRNAHLTFDTPR